MLDDLEILEKLELRRGFENVPDSMKFLKNDDDGDNSEFKLLVNRVWMGRIERMEKVEKGGLGSDELWSWKGHMEAAVRDKGVNAAEALRVYLEEERERPSFEKRKFSNH